MSESDLVDLARQALLNAAMLSAPLLLVGFAVGVLTGMIQAVTQIHDQALSFGPKLLIVLAAFSVALPWLMGHLSEYAAYLFSNYPGR